MVVSPARKISARFTSTYAGFEGESQLLEELYKRGLAQPHLARSACRRWHADGVASRADCAVADGGVTCGDAPVAAPVCISAADRKQVRHDGIEFHRDSTGGTRAIRPIARSSRQATPNPQACRLQVRRNFEAE